MNRILSYIFLSLGLVALTLTIWLFVFLPNILEKRAQGAILNRTGSLLTVSGGHSLQFSPQFGIALYDVSCANSPSSQIPLVTAKKLTFPITFRQILGAQLSSNNLELEQPILNFGVDDRGHSKIGFPDSVSDAKTDANAPLPAPLHITVKNGSISYQNDVTSKTFSLTAMDGLIDVDAQDEITFKAAGLLAQQRVHFSGDLKSLPRAFSEGSPFDFNLEGAGASFGFSGRLVAAKGIDLAGQGTVETAEASRLFTWLGADLHGFEKKQTLSIAAAVESKSSVFLFKKADIRFAQMQAKGDVSFSNDGVRPSLTLDLKVEDLNTNFYAPISENTAPLGGWSDKPFDLTDIKAVDAQFRLVANKLQYGRFSVGPAEIGGQLKDSILNAKIKNADIGNFDLNFDAHQSPPKLDLNFALALPKAEAFMPSFSHMNWLEGPFSLNGALNTAGASQSDMIGALKGHVEAQSEAATLKGIEIAKLGAHVLAEPVEGWEGETSKPTAFKTKFTIDEGVASVESASLTAPGAKITVTGEVDILRQALNLAADINLNRVDGTPSKIKIDGAWAKPHFVLVK
jgi:uncharacterized protein involved in outer membrane biogenesis